jgi:hypothetical protein
MYLINDVSRKVNLSQKRIREYEKEGFINPDREPNTNNRLYSEFEVQQIQRINHLIHERGFTLACLRQLLLLAPCWNIFACSLKMECDAHSHPHEACWRLREDAAKNLKCPGPCIKCAIYINRDHKTEGVLGQPYNA